MKTITTLALLTGLAVFLSGCIVYVSPDKDDLHIHHRRHHDDGPPPADEKPAPTADSASQ